MPTSRKSWTHRILVAAARGDITDEDLAPTRPEDWIALAETASAHGMLGCLAGALRARPGVPPDFQMKLQAAGIRLAAAHREHISDAVAALRLLGQVGIETLVLKGPALVERYYGDPTTRSYGDVDLYVRPGSFRSALDTLSSAGFQLIDRNWNFLVEDLRGQVHLVSRNHRTVELHWHVVNGARQRRTLRMDPDELWDAVVAWDLGGQPARVLPPGEEIAHLCLHAAMHGCNRLIWLLDIATITRTTTVDWDTTIARLRRWRFATGGGSALMLARALAGAEIPDSVLEALKPGPAYGALRSRLMERWDLAEPEGNSRLRELFFATAADRLRTRVGLAVDVVVPAPGQQAASGPEWVQALRRATIGTANRVAAKLRGGGRDPLSEYRDVGDPQAGREAYLERIDELAVSHRRAVVVLSPSVSVGMSHYARALAEAMSRWTETRLIDAAELPGRRWGMWARLHAARRDDPLILVTSPHWSAPLLLLGRKVFGGFVFHDPILDAAMSFTRPLHALYYRLMTRRLPVVILHGSMFRHHVLQLRLPARRIAVVPHGFVPHDLEVDEPYDPSGPFVFLGRLHAYKGLRILLDAIRVLHERGANVPVVIGGHGVAEDLIGSTWPDVLLRPGELNDEEFRSYIAACSAVVLPYERANQSGILATAVRAGRPVIASRVGSFPEYVEDGVGGLLIPPGDAEALAGAMHRVRSDPDFARKLAHGATVAWRDRLSPEVCALQVLRALDPAGWSGVAHDEKEPRPTPRSAEESSAR